MMVESSKIPDPQRHGNAFFSLITGLLHNNPTIFFPSWPLCQLCRSAPILCPDPYIVPLIQKKLQVKGTSLFLLSVQFLLTRQEAVLLLRQ